MVLTKVVFPFFTIIDFVSPSLALGKPSSVATHEELHLTSLHRMLAPTSPTREMYVLSVGILF